MGRVGPWVERVARRDPRGDALPHRVGRRRFRRQAGVDGAVGERGDVVGIGEVDGVDVLVGEANRLKRLIERRCRAGARARQRDLHALEIGHCFIAAAVHELLANDEDLVAIARRRVAVAADDLDANAARHRVVKGRVGRAGGDIDVAGAERRHHLAAGIENGWVGLDAFFRKIAALHGDQNGEIGRRVGDRDVDLVGGAGGGRGRAEGDHQKPERAEQRKFHRRQAPFARSLCRRRGEIQPARQ